ncbi:LysE family translocator [Maricurvus nonylphenolicus]|uniref:LysE family translocator n=1 Tax=Maricurvus nonylphenolicus TaxID=1008307 RepID=UPI0036F28DA9
MPIESIVTFIFASALISVAPGPDNIFVLTQSALYGRKSGVIVTLGLCTGLLVHTAAVALGVAAIVLTSPLAFNLLKYLGAAYLLYLAWLAFSAKPSALPSSNNGLVSAKALYRRGIIMNVTNPKVAIFFLAFLPQFADPQAGSLAGQFLLLGALFIIVALAVFVSIAYLAGALGQWITNSPKGQLYLNRIAGGVFIGLAIKLIISSAAS